MIAVLLPTWTLRLRDPRYLFSGSVSPNQRLLPSWIDQPSCYLRTPHDAIKPPCDRIGCNMAKLRQLGQQLGVAKNNCLVNGCLGVKEHTSSYPQLRALLNGFYRPFTPHVWTYRLLISSRFLLHVAMCVPTVARPKPGLLNGFYVPRAKHTLKTSRDRTSIVVPVTQTLTYDHLRTCGYMRCKRILV